jgi:hypothetical protein
MDDFDMDAAVDETMKGIDTDADADAVTDEIEGSNSIQKVNQETESTQNTQGADQNVEAEQSKTSAPNTWRKEAAVVWDQLPAAAQAEILKREADIFSGIESYKADAGYGNSFKQALAPYLSQLQARGADPVDHVKGLLSSFDVMERGSPEQKLEVFRKAASDYGINLEQLNQERPYIDPEVAIVNSQLEQVRQEIQQLKSYRDQEVRSSINSEIESFSKDPANVHFHELSNDMADLIQKGICSNLKDAYDKAIWLNASVREKHLANAAAKSTKSAEKARLDKLKTAKAASASNITVSAKHGGDTASNKSIDDTIKETYDAIMAR